VKDGRDVLLLGDGKWSVPCRIKLWYVKNRTWQTLAGDSQMTGRGVARLEINGLLHDVLCQGLKDVRQIVTLT
jgi:hypothetical protein